MIIETFKSTDFKLVALSAKGSVIADYIKTGQRVIIMRRLFNRLLSDKYGDQQGVIVDIPPLVAKGTVESPIKMLKVLSPW